MIRYKYPGIFSRKSKIHERKVEEYIARIHCNTSHECIAKLMQGACNLEEYLSQVHMIDIQYFLIIIFSPTVEGMS